jgi:hypothetical protein
MSLTTRASLYFTVLLVTAILPVSVFAQPTERNSSLVEQLAQQIALKHQLSEAPDEILSQFVQNPLQLPADKNERMLELFKDAYQNEKLLDDFKAALQQEMEGQYKNEISQWLNREPTQMVTEARQEFYTLQGKRKRVITMYEMDQDQPSDERKELISTLANSSSAAESSVESSVIILRSVIRTLSELSEQRNFSEAQINGIANNFRSQIQAQARRQSSDQLLLMYHNVPAPALEDYANFWQSDAGKWLDKAISQSMQTTYEAASERFLKSVK